MVQFVLSLWREHLTFHDRLGIRIVVLSAVQILVLDVDVWDHLILRKVLVHRLYVVHVDRLRNIFIHGRSAPILRKTCINPRRHVFPHLPGVI